MSLRTLSLPHASRTPTIAKVCIFTIPLILVAALATLKLQSSERYWAIAAAEDGPVEYLTSALYVAAFGFALVTAFDSFREGRRAHAALSALVALGCAFVALEEISWGQRILGVPTPAVLTTYNGQGELNIHNIADRYLLHGAFICAGAYGTFGFLFFRRRAKAASDPLWKLIVFPWWLALYFVPVLLIYLYYDYLSPFLVAQFGVEWDWQSSRQDQQRFMIAKDQEPAEFIMALGVALFTATNMGRHFFSHAPRYRYSSPTPPRAVGSTTALTSILDAGIADCRSIPSDAHTTSSRSPVDLYARSRSAAGHRQQDRDAFHVASEPKAVNAIDDGK